jgi:hypothetical protein
MGFVTACKGSRGMGRRLRGGGRSTVSRHVGGAVLLSFIMLGAWSASARGYVWWESNNDGLVTSELDGSNLQRTACQEFAVKDARYLYFPGPASGALIGRESLDCSQVDNTFVLDTGAGGGTVYAVAVDSAHIYWSDANGIGRANIDGSNATSGFVPASAIGGTPQDIAVDAGHIYWSGVAQGIGRANLDGSNPLANWLATAQYPRALATDGSHLYWSEPGGIGRVNTDGTGLTDPFVAYSGSDGTASITTDSHYLYWAQEGQIFGQGGTIGRANLDGSGVNPAFIAPSVGVGGAGIAVDSGTASASATSLACSPTVYESYIGDIATWALDAAGMCTVTVRDVGSAAGSPGGSVVVSYAGEDPQATLPCLLKASGAGASQCTVEEPLAGNGNFQAYFGAHKVLARYGGETFHLPSSAAPATTNVSKAPAPAKVTAGVTGVVSVLAGKVLISVPGSRGSFAPLKGSAVSVPIGATIDARKGTVKLATAADYRSAVDRRHRIQTGTFSAGMFAVEQLTARQERASERKHKRRLTGIAPTDLVLKNPPGAANKAGCRSTGPPGKGVVRSLTGVAKGVYRTVGAASTTTVQSASWTVQDRCDGTLTTVHRGHATIVYTAHGRHHTVALRSGQAYIVAARFLEAERTHDERALDPELRLTSSPGGAWSPQRWGSW